MSDCVQREINESFDICDKMKGSTIGRKVIYYQTVDSTNLVAKELSKQKDTHGFVVLAREQTKGRGRLGREWISNSSDDVFMSVILKPSILPEQASMLTLVTALAVNKGIKDFTGLHSQIKWPNDIVIQGKKVCGILTEMSTIKENLEYVVIGIGINVNRRDFPEELHHIASSIYLESGQTWDKTQLIVDILWNLECYYKCFLKTNDLSNLMEEYNSNLVNCNKQVRIIEDNKESIGIAAGINKLGGLLIYNDMKDEMKTVVSGEVSVRGIYGYI